MDHLKFWKRIGTLAYKVKLPEKLNGVHNVFHVSQLRKSIRNQSDVIEPEIQKELEIEPNLTVIRNPVKIVDKEEKELRNNKKIKLIKVQWSNNEKDCTWEAEEKIRRNYPDFVMD